MSNSLMVLTQSSCSVGTSAIRLSVRRASPAVMRPRASVQQRVRTLKTRSWSRCSMPWGDFISPSRSTSVTALLGNHMGSGVAERLRNQERKEGSLRAGEPAALLER